MNICTLGMNKLAVVFTVNTNSKTCLVLCYSSFLLCVLSFWVLQDNLMTIVLLLVETYFFLKQVSSFVKAESDKSENVLFVPA